MRYYRTSFRKSQVQFLCKLSTAQYTLNTPFGRAKCSYGTLNAPTEREIQLQSIMNYELCINFKFHTSNSTLAHTPHFKLAMPHTHTHRMFSAPLFFYVSFVYCYCYFYCYFYCYLCEDYQNTLPPPCFKLEINSCNTLPPP